MPALSRCRCNLCSWDRKKRVRLKIQLVPLASDTELLGPDLFFMTNKHLSSKRDSSPTKDVSSVNKILVDVSVETALKIGLNKRNISPRNGPIMRNGVIAHRPGSSETRTFQGQLTPLLCVIGLVICSLQVCLMIINGIYKASGSTFYIGYSPELGICCVPLML